MSFFEDNPVFYATVKDGKPIITLNGTTMFKFYQEYGFPPEMYIEEMQNVIKDMTLEQKMYWANHSVELDKP
jgi:alanyl-tRNA synthetase